MLPTTPKISVKAATAPRKSIRRMLRYIQCTNWCMSRVKYWSSILSRCLYTCSRRNMK